MGSSRIRKIGFRGNQDVEVPWKPSFKVKRDSTSLESKLEDFLRSLYLMVSW